MDAINTDLELLESQARNSSELRQTVGDVVLSTPAFDMHTHLFAPQFGEMNLWGVDELVTYHYLIAELFRFSTVTPQAFWSMSKSEQADLIWQTIFVRHTPLSEAARGVVRVLTSLGLDPRGPDLRDAREFFRAQRAEDYLDRVLRMSNVSTVVMTNDPFDEVEASFWEQGFDLDPRFRASLRIDPLLLGWDGAAGKIAAQGFAVESALGSITYSEARRFLESWIKKIKPLYMAVSLPDSFAFPDDSVCTHMLREVVLPVCRVHELSFAMMIGVKRSVNPALRGAGDGVGRADASAVERIAAAFPDNKFLVTMLSRENQHELCVVARKFSNVMPFGCWWFLNNPSIISEITEERIELLGTSFIAQHSDARILDQLIYKWEHSRRVIADALYRSYDALKRDGWTPTREEIARDAEQLFSGNFRNWVGQ
jgi:hypothetical protein